jgi:ParB family chromosome partitioning protein
VVIVEAFGDIREIRENHARIVKPLLNDDQARPKVMAAAKLLSGEQAARVKAGEPVIDAARVIERLKTAGAGKGSAPRANARPKIHSSEAGARLFSLTPKGAKRAMIELSLDANATNDDFHLRPGK